MLIKIFQNVECKRTTNVDMPNESIFSTKIPNQLDEKKISSKLSLQFRQKNIFLSSKSNKNETKTDSDHNEKRKEKTNRKTVALERFESESIRRKVQNIGNTNYQKKQTRKNNWTFGRIKIINYRKFRPQQMEKEIIYKMVRFLWVEENDPTLLNRTKRARWQLRKCFQSPENIIKVDGIRVGWSDFQRVCKQFLFSKRQIRDNLNGLHVHLPNVVWLTVRLAIAHKTCAFFIQLNATFTTFQAMCVPLLIRTYTKQKAVKYSTPTTKAVTQITAGCAAVHGQKGHSWCQCVRYWMWSHERREQMKESRNWRTSVQIGEKFV